KAEIGGKRSDGRCRGSAMPSSMDSQPPRWSAVSMRLRGKSSLERLSAGFPVVRSNFGSGELVELVQFSLEEFFVGQRGLVFGDESGRNRSGEGVFDDFVVFGGAEEDADRRAFVGFFDIAVESFEVELHFA